MAASHHPAHIIGAGIGGLTLARCLLKHGVPAVLFEKAPASSRHGYGITLHASTYRPLLEILGLDEGAFKRRIAVDGEVGGTGVINPSLLVNPTKVEAASFRAHRGKLEKLLGEGLSIQWNQPLESVEQTAGGNILCFEGGQRVESGFVVGADGIHSKTRKSLSSNASPKILPYVAFNGKRRVGRALFDETYAPAMGDSNVIERRVGDAVLNVSINDQHTHTVSISWTYSRKSRGATDPLHKPDRPVSGATVIPEEFFAEVGALKGLHQPFREVFDAENLRSERILHWLMRTVLVGQDELVAFADRGVYLVGDAAHAEQIIGGEGANNAITDAIHLAEQIATSGQSGIPSWYGSRYGGWQEHVKKSEKTIEMMHRD